MQIDIRQMEEGQENDYRSLLNVCPWAMIYHSIGYRNFLQTFMPTAEAYYFLAYVDGQVVGALPTFVLDGPLGPVVNSLPFFGSHGSVLLRPDAAPDVDHELVRALKAFCAERHVAFVTAIDTPFAQQATVFEQELGVDHRDHRIGQLCDLPSADGTDAVEVALLAQYHQKTRNIVRKAVKSGLQFGHSGSSADLSDLMRLHRDNMQSIGGSAKPAAFFDAIAKSFQYDRDYRIYTARDASGQTVAAMMLLYYKGYVEYFVPATDAAWRTSQPLSALIFLAMRDAVVERASSVWNWGGTWPTQDGVYHFKSRWGTRDLPYSYYTRVFVDFPDVMELGRAGLLQSYPWFFTLPFSALEAP